MSMKVLIVDQDWRFAEQASAFLEAQAHLVVHLPSSSGVMEQVRRWQPDLVIVADELGLDGLLKSLHSLSPRPAVLLTGWLDRYDRLWRAWQLGGDELLIKPFFHTDQLQQAVITARENATCGTRRIAPASASA